jgi:hypothetical protein
MIAVPSGEEKMLGITGTQRGCTVAQRDVLAATLKLYTMWFSVLHHGDCVGVDAEACHLAMRDYYLWSHPCNLYRKRAYIDSGMVEDEKAPLDRNWDIVLACSTLIACPGEMTEQLRSGTWATIRYARKAGKTIVFIYPDGSTEIEGGTGT